MRITVLGGCGAWPMADQACSGYLVEHDGFRLLMDPGYATLPRLLEHVTAEQVDAVWISHGHPDHCADLNPLLRARALGGDSPSALPVYAPDGAALAYTGDTGPSPDVVVLAREADLLLAEATYVDEVPQEDAPYLTTARQAGRQATEAAVGGLVLTHLWPGTDPAAARHVAGETFGGQISVARAGSTMDLGC